MNLAEMKFESMNVWKVKKTNAGRQLCRCIHINSLKIVDMNMLSAFSDQGRQPHWSEIMQTVPGSLLPAVVRPAPFTNFCLNVSSLKIKGITPLNNCGSRPSLAISRKGGCNV